MSLKLHERQTYAFYSPATEFLYGGAAGGGKSFLLRVSAIRWCESVPGVQVYLFRRTFPDLKANHLRGPTSFLMLLGPMIASGRVSYRKQENEFVWNDTDSRIALCHCQHEDDVIKYQGSEIHVLLMDELTHFTEYQYRFLRGRVRCIGLNLKGKADELLPRIECGSNPGGIGHKWVKKTFRLGSMSNGIDPTKIWYAGDGEGGFNRQYIPALAQDNPSLLTDDPGYFDRLRGLGNAELVKAMAEGNWDIFSNQFFDEWDFDLHVCEPFEIPSHWKKYIGVDYGYVAPSAVVWMAISDEGTCYIYRELYANGLTYEKLRDAILILSDGEKIEHAAVDPAMRMKTQGFGVVGIEVLNKQDEIRFLEGDNGRIAGWQRVREYLRILKDSDGRKYTRLKIFNSCKNLIETFPSLVHDDNNVEDLKKNSDDHLADALRYLLMSRPSPPNPIPIDPTSHLDLASRKFWLDFQDESEQEKRKKVVKKIFGW